MSVLTDFYTQFEIPKVRYLIPGREYDDEGNLCSWYEEWQYPEITGDIYFDLLEIYLQDNPPFACEITPSFLIEAILEKFLEQKDKYKEEVKELFEEYAKFFSMDEDDIL